MELTHMSANRWMGVECVLHILSSCKDKWNNSIGRKTGGARNLSDKRTRLGIRKIAYFLSYADPRFSFLYVYTYMYVVIIYETRKEQKDISVGRQGWEQDKVRVKTTERKEKHHLTSKKMKLLEEDNKSRMRRFNREVCYVSINKHVWNPLLCMLTFKKGLKFLNNQNY